MKNVFRINEYLNMYLNFTKYNGVIAQLNEYPIETTIKRPL